MLTNKDNEIRTADIPERFQVCCKKLIICFEKVKLHILTVRDVIYEKHKTQFIIISTRRRELNI